MADSLDKELHVIASEIEGLMLSGNVRAVAAVVITGDGTMHTRIRYIPGGRAPLLGAITLVQHNLVRMIESDVSGSSEQRGDVG